MSAVRISVGASSDGSMATVFRPLIQAARLARVAVNAEFRAMQSEADTSFKMIAGQAATAFAAVTAAEKKELERQVQAVEKAEAEKKRLREQSRARGGGGGGGGGGNGRDGSGNRDNPYRTGLASVRYLDRTLRGAGGTAMDIARGAGVDLDLGHAIGKSVGMSKMATDISNSAYQPNNPNPNDPSRTRVAGSVIMASARDAANKAALDPMKALEGIQNFVGVSGDLDTARSIMGDLGQLSRATGTEFEDMVTAAGEVSAKLGDVPDKGNVVLGVMRALAGQGKLSAVEIKNMAREMAKVGSVADKFNMKPQEAMVVMGALMQEARQRGGSESASASANAAMALISTMTQGKTIKALQKYGVQPFADPGTGPGKNTKLLGPETMILAALYKSGGSLKILGDMFKDKMAMKAVTGFATLYSNTKGDQNTKLQAVRDEFDRLKKSAMGKGEVQSSLDLSMANPDAKIQLFNNKLDEIGTTIAGKVLPQLERLAPTIIQGVEAFGKFVAWAAENPGKALAAALTLSIARAGIDTVLRAGIENLMRGGGGGGSGGGGGGGKFGGFAAGLGSALTIVATALTIKEVGQLIIDKVLKDKADERDKNENEDFAKENAERVARAAAQGKGGAADIELLTRRRDAQLARLNNIDEVRKGGFWGAIKNTLTGEEGGYGGYKSAVDDSKNQGEIAAEAQNLSAAIDKLIAAQGKVPDGVMKVQVVGGAPTADKGGTSPGRK